MPKRKYTEEMIDFLRNHTGSYKQRREDFEKKFGIELTEGKLDHLADRYGFRHGHKTYPHQIEVFKKFQKRGVEVRSKEVGYTRRDKRGEIWIKAKHEYKNRKNFIQLSRYVYQKHYNVTLTPKDYIIYLDGNKENVDPSNLALVSQGENAVLNKLGLRTDNAEFTKVGINIAKIVKRIGELKRCKKKDK